MVSLSSEIAVAANPIDLLEELVAANDWAFDRASATEMVVEIAGRWSDYHLCCVWHEACQAMYVSCHFDVRVPESRRRAVAELLMLANEKLWIGHFDLATDDGMIAFRHTIPLRGVAGISAEQLEDLVDSAVNESERFFPALQLLVWGGKSASEAWAAALMETVGEA